MTVCDRIAGAGELALRANGLDGERLLRMAYAVAHSYCRQTGSGLDSRIDDLAQHLALTATRRALNFKPELCSTSFTSYLFDIMEPACVDWMRKKGEGFGDRRYGHDGRLVLAGDHVEDITVEDTHLEDDGHTPAPHWRHAATLLQQPFMEWPRVTERRVLAWTRAAEEVGLTLDEFIARAADVYASAAMPEAA